MEYDEIWDKFHKTEIACLGLGLQHESIVFSQIYCA